MVAQPIRIAHVLEATAGGTRQYLMDVCLGLPRARFAQTAVVSCQRSAAFRADMDVLAEAGVQVHEVPMTREISPRQDLQALRALRQYFRTNEFDIIHCHSSKAGMLGRLAAWLARSRAVRIYSPHAFAFQMQVAWHKRTAYRFLEWCAGRITHLLVCTAPSERELALRARIIAPERALVVPTGVDVRRFRPGLDASGLRDELGISRQHRLVGAVGALVPQKGHQYLVEAAAEVIQQMPHTTFVIAGEGPLRDELQARVSELGLGRRFRLLGHYSDVPRLLCALDLFVMPSLWEGLPYALLEAMAVGVPVVATRIPGLVDLVEPGNTGWLAAPRSAEELAGAIVNALSEPGQSAIMAQNARARVLAEHTRERMLELLAAVYERAVEEPGP